MPTTSVPRYLHKPRLYGWSLAVLGILCGYLYWAIGDTWWIPTVIGCGAVILAAFVFNVYLAIKAKAYDLFLAGLLALLSPAIVIAIAFGCCFSEVPA